MQLPAFNYATLEFINTWQYSDGSEGCMGIARLHSSASPDVTVALFTQGPRHQSTFENLFATKAKFSFTVEATAVDAKMNQFIPDALKRSNVDPCDAPSAGAFTVRAVFYPVCK
jgi:hypothetical protein